MRKINTIICMLLMFVCSSMYAQQGWNDPSSENATEIIADGNHYYALRRGFTEKKLIDGYLNFGTNKLIDAFNNSCVYQFEEVGIKETTEENFKVYVLKNMKNGQYVCTSGTKYTSAISEAFRFTARKAVEIEKTNKTDWLIYSHSVWGVEGRGCNGAEAAGTWVFCNPDKFQFLSFEQNHNPGFNIGYIECTNWFVYEVTPAELTPFQKFMMLYDEHIASHPFNPESCPIGTNPGCISQELYDKLADAYAQIEDATLHSDMSKEDCEKFSQLILSVVDEYNKGVIQIEEGKYYLIQNCLMGFAKDNGKPYCDGVTEYPTAWDVKNANYIWLADSTSAEGGIFFQNVSTERYLHKKAMSSAPLSDYKTEYLHYGEFSFNDGASFVTAKKGQPDKGYFNSGSAEYTEGRWLFLEVNKNIVDSLAESIAQDRINKQLASLLHRANNNIRSLEYENSITYDGTYLPAAKGLFSKFEKCNSTETREGSKEENAFDGNLNTFYHTCWSNKAPSDDWAWVQLDLGTELQEIVLKMSRRAPGSNVTPTRIAFFAPTDNNVEEQFWKDELYQDTVIWTYPGEYADTIADSCTYIAKIKFSRPARHVRMTSTRTKFNKIYGYGPSWSISEMRVYDPAGCVENEKAKLIPAEVMDALKKSMEKAQNEVNDSIATQATYDELEAALDSMWAAYPNPNGLISRVKSAEDRLSAADESLEEMGYYRQGAKQGLQTAIDAIKKEIDTKVLSLDDIARLENDLKTALKQFNSMLIVPESGIYRIVTASTDTEGNPDNQYGAYVSATHADVNGDIYWRYKDDSSIDARRNTLWKIEKNENGEYSFQNLISGLYIENPYENLAEEEKSSIGTTTHVHWSETPTHFTLEGAPKTGKFLIVLDEDRYMNAAVYTHMAIWNNRGENHSHYLFEPVDVESLNSENYIDCKADQMQIMTYPIDIAYVQTANHPAYKVLGIKDNAIQLNPYDLEETIPAGTPFIIITDKDEVALSSETLVSTADELINIERNRKPVVQNGLVSAPQAFDIEAGFGILFSNKVIVTSGSERIAATTGFFNKDIPTTTELGKQAIPLSGEIIGEGTSVEDVLINNSVSNDVYTISGVKVRSNVKGAAAIEGLAKGIYIVGGKKVIVK